jgi:lipopolysaccharide export LptBFGC system permease protein LptF
MDLFIIVILIILLSLLLSIVSFRLCEEYLTTMQIRKGLIEAKILYDRKYRFRLRKGDFVLVDNDQGILKFEQFRGRL